MDKHWVMKNRAENKYWESRGRSALKGANPAGGMPAEQNESEEARLSGSEMRLAKAIGAAMKGCPSFCRHDMLPAFGALRDWFADRELEKAVEVAGLKLPDTGAGWARGKLESLVHEDFLPFLRGPCAGLHDGTVLEWKFERERLEVLFSAAWEEGAQDLLAVFEKARPRLIVGGRHASLAGEGFWRAGTREPFAYERGAIGRRKVLFDDLAYIHGQEFSRKTEAEKELRVVFGGDHSELAIGFESASFIFGPGAIAAYRESRVLEAEVEPANPAAKAPRI